MGKVKIKKQSTIIDMTAMSDVTVLLLTFFMLTSTFLQKEPVTVITPPSVSEAKVPDEKLVQVLVAPNGKVYLNMTGAKDSTQLSTETFRKEVLLEVYGDRKPGLTQKQVKEFCNLGTFGMPLNKISDWLNMPMEKRDEALKEEGGIPIKMSVKTTTEDGQSAAGQPNEFQVWLKAIRQIMHNHGLDDDLRGGHLVAIKAEQNCPYSLVQVVMDNLQTEKLNKFTLMTSLKQEAEE